MRKLLISLFVLLLVASACGDAGTDDDSAGTDDVASVDDAGSEETADSTEDGEASADGGVEIVTESDSSGSDGASTKDESSFAEEAPAVPSEGDTADIVAEPPPVDDGPTPQAGTLTAGDIDDNLNFNFFTGYLERTQSTYGQALPQINVGDRVILEVIGANSVGLANAQVEITSSQKTATVFTNSAGTAYLFPTQFGLGEWGTLDITVRDGRSDAEQTFMVTSADFEADGTTIVLNMDDATGQNPSSLDVALVLDVTGSMTDELRYLTVEFESIIARVSQTYSDADIRFALVVYRDEGDDFVTRVFDFTNEVGEMQLQLAAQVADGGGDFPEAMDQALAEANGLSWRSGDVARVIILNADAPPHSQDLDQTMSEVDIARTNGVRIYPLAASGVDNVAEYIMRSMATLTGGRHLFLTDDSGVGGTHQEPKTQCYVVTRLDQLLVRVLESELAGERVEAGAEEIIRTVGSYEAGVCAEQ